MIFSENDKPFKQCWQLSCIFILWAVYRLQSTHKEYFSSNKRLLTVAKINRIVFIISILEFWFSKMINTFFEVQCVYSLLISERELSRKCEVGEGTPYPISHPHCPVEWGHGGWWISRQQQRWNFVIVMAVNYSNLVQKLCVLCSVYYGQFSLICALLKLTTYKVLRGEGKQPLKI